MYYLLHLKGFISTLSISGTISTSPIAGTTSSSISGTTSAISSTTSTSQALPHLLTGTASLFCAILTDSGTTSRWTTLQVIPRIFRAPTLLLPHRNLSFLEHNRPLGTAFAVDWQISLQFYFKVIQFSPEMFDASKMERWLQFNCTVLSCVVLSGCHLIHAFLNNVALLFWNK